MLIIAITGMPGAGKSTAADALQTSGLKKIVMGDVIREETLRRGLEPDQNNTGKVMLELRERYGAGAVAEVCLDVLKSVKENVVVVDGIRSIAEVEAFGRAGKVKLLAVHASRDRRFEFLTARGRSDAPASRASFDERDSRELSIGVGNAVAIADEIISNEHTTLDEFVKKAVGLVTIWVESNGRRPA